MESSTPDPVARKATSPAATSLARFRAYTYWSMVVATGGVIVLLTLTGPAAPHLDPVGIATLLCVAVTCVAVARLTEHHLPRTLDTARLSRREWLLWAVAGGVASLPVAATWLAAGDELFWPFAPALIASLLLASLPRRPRQVAVGIAILVAAGTGSAIGLLGGDGPGALPLGGAATTSFVLFLTLASIWTWQVALQLDEARHAAATLAVANERLRFAAELHDIQGHHLQVIALKSELAARLVRPDPEAAEGEMMAVRELAADALRDTRAVVQGYRRTTLEAEIANATSVLGSAGIDARLRLDPELQRGELPEATRHLLGLVLREAVTNVLRHSSASTAEVTLSRDEVVRLTVSNDGVHHDVATGAGGLNDLAERVHAAGGRLSWRRAGQWFEVHTALPPEPGPTVAADRLRRAGSTRATADAPAATEERT